MTDFIIQDDPRLQQQKSLIQHIQEEIYNDPQQCPWYDPQLLVDWNPPDPIFT